jgi:hypothetical protein
MKNVFCPGIWNWKFGIRNLEKNFRGKNGTKNTGKASGYY